MASSASAPPTGVQRAVADLRTAFRAADDELTTLLTSDIAWLHSTATELARAAFPRAAPSQAPQSGQHGREPVAPAPPAQQPTESSSSTTSHPSAPGCTRSKRMKTRKNIPQSALKPDNNCQSRAATALIRARGLRAAANGKSQQDDEQQYSAVAVQADAARLRQHDASPVLYAPTDTRDPTEKTATVAHDETARKCLGSGPSAAESPLRSTRKRSNETPKSRETGDSPGNAWPYPRSPTNVDASETVNTEMKQSLEPTAERRSSISETLAFEKVPSPVHRRTRGARKKAGKEVLQPRAVSSTTRTGAAKRKAAREELLDEAGAQGLSTHSSADPSKRHEGPAVVKAEPRITRAHLKRQKKFNLNTDDKENKVESARDVALPELTSSPRALARMTRSTRARPGTLVLSSSKQEARRRRGGKKAKPEEAACQIGEKTTQNSRVTHGLLPENTKVRPESRSVEVDSVDVSSSTDPNRCRLGEEVNLQPKLATENEKQLAVGCSDADAAEKVCGEGDKAIEASSDSCGVCILAGNEDTSGKTTSQQSPDSDDNEDSPIIRRPRRGHNRRAGKARKMSETENPSQSVPKPLPSTPTPLIVSAPRQVSSESDEEVMTEHKAQVVDEGEIGEHLREHAQPLVPCTEESPLTDRVREVDRKNPSKVVKVGDLEAVGLDTQHSGIKSATPVNGETDTTLPSTDNPAMRQETSLGEGNASRFDQDAATGKAGEGNASRSDQDTATGKAGALKRALERAPNAVDPKSPEFKVPALPVFRNREHIGIEMPLSKIGLQRNANTSNADINGSAIVTEETSQRETDAERMPPPPLPHVPVHSENPHQTPTVKQQLRICEPSSRGGRFQIDERGKVDAASIGVLNGICATPVLAASKSGIPNMSKGNANARPNRLFAGTTDIYSSTRKPPSSRIGRINSSSVRSSSTASRTLGTGSAGSAVPMRRLATARVLDPSDSSSSQGQPSLLSAPPNAKPSEVENAKVGSSSAIFGMKKEPQPETATVLHMQDMKHDQHGTTSSDLSQKLLQDPGSESPKVGRNSTSSNDRKRSSDDFATTQKPEKRARIAPDDPKLSKETVSSELCTLPSSGKSDGPRTAPLKNLRRPRIVHAKSALRSRIEGLREKDSSGKPRGREYLNGDDETTAETTREMTADMTADLTADLTAETTVETTAETTADMTTETAREITGKTMGELKNSVERISTVQWNVCNDAKGTDFVPYGSAPGQPKWGSVDNPSRPRRSGTGADASADDRLADKGQNSSSQQEKSTANGQSAVVKHGESLSTANTLGNLMTSISSFLPSFRPRKEASPTKKAEIRAQVAQADAERREADIAARKEAARVARQKDAVEKQRRAEAKRLLMAEAEKHREDERKQKEAERTRKLLEAEEQRKRAKEDERREKAEKRRRVEEHQRQLAAQETARRAALEEKERVHRERLKRAKGLGAPTTGPGSTRGHGVANGQQLTSHTYAPTDGPVLSKAGGLNVKHAHGGHGGHTTTSHANAGGTGKGKSAAPESYEMSAYKADSYESDEDRARRSKKRVPGWARSANLPAALVRETRDPDTIFERVHTISLDDVFEGLPGRKFRPRTSSGAWVRDRLTAQEEMEYKRDVGFWKESEPKEK